ncbi:cell cycle histidine kinase CckA [Methylocapsa palsarum]|uniref:histidine kinase n=1 Tax=Methylocapsa palsarum TaxID=1612308 RepID=A0A1I4C4B1_9HYPH|nr:response regulator [Methylocapsa palsarum]SFK75944.1 two-component system, cell cycle sensor histidine kinase and response regulator CckA [Methylocapsa palsarum]
MTEQDISARDSTIGRPWTPRAGGNPFLVLALALATAAIAAAFSFLPKELAAHLAAGALGVLAVIGVCALFAFALGLAGFASQSPDGEFARLASDGAPEGLVATDSAGALLYANAAYRNYCGAAAVRPVEQLFSGAPEVSEAIYRLAQASRRNRRGEEELRLSRALEGGGQAGWYKISVRPIETADGARVSLWSVVDVTHERKRQEDAFQDLRRAIDFLDDAPAGFFSSNAHGSVSYMNATLAAWLGYDVAHAAGGGLRLGEFLAGDGVSLLASVAGGPGEVRTEQFDIDLKRAGGEILPARLLHRVAFDEEGRPGPSRTLVLNRESGVEPAEDLRAAEVRFARVFNATPVAIALLDGEGRIKRSNAAFARLMPRALKAAEPIYSAIAEPDRNALKTALAAALRSKTDIAPLDAALEGDGERSARLFVSPSDDRDGRGATIYALDTTEQQALRTNFEQSQKMQAIGQLAGGVAHDFNNVLTAIIGFSDLLLANHRPTDPSFHDIMQIKQNANRAAGLVRQLLAFSRRQTMRPQILQLGDVLADLQILMRRLVGEKIDLDLRHGRDLWLVKADVNQFEQVIVNLIVNARDAMPEGGKILLRTRNVAAADCGEFDEPSLTPADYVAIEVVDAGHGIAPEVRDKIFEPFFTTKEIGKGTGLGLSMVYGIVKQTGGFVVCASTVGKGSTFSILLPRHVASESDAPPAAEAAKAPAKDLTGHGTILLVEDEEAVRAFGARALASRGYTVLQAASGLEALEVVEQNEGKIDLVVSDVVMPEMDGPTMFGELRKRGVKAKVIFVSGYAEDAFQKNLPEGEVFSFLPKPFSLKQLIEAVKGAKD